MKRKGEESTEEARVEEKKRWVGNPRRRGSATCSACRRTVSRRSYCDRNEEEGSVCVMDRIFGPRINVQIVNEPQAVGQSLVELQGRGRDGVVERSGVGRVVGHDAGGDDGECRGRVTTWWMSI